MSSSDIEVWDVFSGIGKGQRIPGQSATIMLNMPLDFQVYDMFWKATSIHICADGGTNRLFDSMTECPQKRNEYLPDFIVGDFDSIRPEVHPPHVVLIVHAI
eukprot:m.144813 g.144813  ORF g.144813 m.144813 type:complete len:102 (-) comp17722_c1_seq14:314-619(-)